VKTPVNLQTIRQHLTYHWWKYVLVILFAIFGTDLLYTVTAYRSPANKVIEFYVYGAMDETRMDAYMEQVRLSDLPDQEIMDASLLIEDETYGLMQLSTYIAAGEGDLYLLPKNEFVGYAGAGAFLPLEGDTELMSLFDEAGVSLQSGWRRETDTGENHLFGIPLARLPGLTHYAYAKDGYLCVLISGGNNDNVMKFLRILCRDMLQEPPEAVQDAPSGEQP